MYTSQLITSKVTEIFFSFTLFLIQMCIFIAKLRNILGFPTETNAEEKQANHSHSIILESECCSPVLQDSMVYDLSSEF